MIPRELHTHLVGVRIAAPVVVIGPIKFNNTTTDDATVNLFYATRKLRFVGGSYIMDAEATAATTFTATVEVGTQQLSQDLDIKTLAADTVAHFLPSATSNDRDIAKGALVELNFDQTGGTVTAPGNVEVVLEFQLIE
jgi:hypothetical protein